jgi:uncharacterized membrane protein YciS (DUF1049 family)
MKKTAVLLLATTIGAIIGGLISFQLTVIEARHIGNSAMVLPYSVLGFIAGALLGLCFYLLFFKLKK